MKHYLPLLVFRSSLSIVLGIVFLSNSYSQNDTIERIFRYAEENQACFKCHGQKKYFYYNDWIERSVKENMNPFYIIDSANFYQSNHWDFRCTDCHSDEYEMFPHPGELRMEEKYTCLDCHGGDDTYAEYQFEHIDEEFHKSVHSSKHDEEFTCWMCHNPHSYKINARSDLQIVEVIAYDNEICLSCHADIDKYQLITNKENPNVIESHDWLPNQKRHFLHVRCIECHAEYDEEVLVAHNVQTKDKAMKLCVNCHSENSILLATLYKYQIQEKREVAGFYNSIFMLEESYVIGANRNRYLNNISLIIFAVVILLIFAHFTLRIITKK